MNQYEISPASPFIAAGMGMQPSHDHSAAERAYHEATRSGAGWGEVVRGVIPRIIDDLLTRLEQQLDRLTQFRENRHYYYKGRAEQGLAVVLVVVVLAALGALTAVALTSEGGGTSYFSPANPSSASFTGRNEPKVLTVYVVRRPAGQRNVVVKTVSRRTSRSGLPRLPGQTVREVRTLTTEQIATVKDVQSVTVTAPPVTVTNPPVTVTVVETVKCKPKDC